MLARCGAWVAAFALTAIPLSAQVRDSYNRPDEARGCIGGARCGGFDAKLRIRLEGRPVSEISFRAHDNIGGQRNGRLSVSIDGRPLEESIDISSQQEWYTLDARGLRGRELVFEPTSDDEVEISDVRVTYGGIGEDEDEGGRQGGCIGGRRCGGFNSELRIRIRPGRSVSRVSFRAHDDIGDSRNGRLKVSIGETPIESPIDISSRPEQYTLDARGLRGRELVFEPMSDDEVEISDVRVDYGGGGGGGDDGGGESHQGGCIGGSRCGGSRAAIRILLRNRPVREIIFEAHDNIGDRSNGRLRIRIDDAYLERGLDIDRTTQPYTLRPNGTSGRELVFEPASSDEVEVRNIRVRYGRVRREGDWP